MFLAFLDSVFFQLTVKLQPWSIIDKEQVSLALSILDSSWKQQKSYSLRQETKWLACLIPCYSDFTAVTWQPGYGMLWTRPKRMLNAIYWFLRTKVFSRMQELACILQFCLCLGYLPLFKSWKFNPCLSFETEAWAAYTFGLSYLSWFALVYVLLTFLWAVL